MPPQLVLQESLSCSIGNAKNAVSELRKLVSWVEGAEKNIHGNGENLLRTCYGGNIEYAPAECEELTVKRVIKSHPLAKGTYEETFSLQETSHGCDIEWKIESPDAGLSGALRQWMLSSLSRLKHRMSLENGPYRRNGKSLLGKVKASGSIKESIKRSLDLIGGLDKVIKPGDEVILKPNYNSHHAFPGSTDPEFLGAVVELVKDCGASRVIVFEGSGCFWLPTRKTMTRAGAVEAAEAAGAEVIFSDEENWVKVDVPGKYVKKTFFAERALDPKYKIVWLPLVKTHMTGVYTMSLKLVMGWQKLFDRLAKVHLGKLGQKVAELSTLVIPDVIITDCRKCFVTQGPYKGREESPGVIFSSADRIANDVTGLRILKGYKAKNKLKCGPWDFAQVSHGVSLGLGAATDDEIEILREGD